MWRLQQLRSNGKRSLYWSDGKLREFLFIIGRVVALQMGKMRSDDGGGD